MKKTALALSLLSGVVFAQEAKTQSLDPCGSPKEVYTKHMLDRCYEGYFKAIMESKKNAEEALRIANEANRKVGDLEKRVGALEKTSEDHERRIRALEGLKPEERSQERPRLEADAHQKRSESDAKRSESGVTEEIGTIYFDFGTFTIKSSEAKKLDELVNRLKEAEGGILVVGFADKRGPSEYNFNLSMWRAQMVASHLAQKGVDVGKIRITSYGSEIADLLGKNHSEQRVVKIFVIR